MQPLAYVPGTVPAQPKASGAQGPDRLNRSLIEKTGRA